MISDALLARYHMPTLAAYIDRHKSAGGFYATFLAQTDYVAAKLAEAAYLGQTPNEDYTEVLAARQEAREEINKLKEARDGI